MMVVCQFFLYVNELSVISAFFTALQTACFAGVTIIEKLNTACAMQPYVSQSSETRLASAVAVELIHQDFCFLQEDAL